MTPYDFPAANRLVSDRLGGKETHGLSVLLFDEEAVLHERHWGYQEIEQRIRLAPNTVVPLGSLSKLLTAVAVHQQKERGLLQLDAACVAYLPELRGLLPDEITIRHLLAHTSGLTSTGYFEDQIQALQGHGPLRAPADDFQSLVDNHLREAWQVAPAGERFCYSNEGYLLLGEIIGRTSGASFADYLGRHVLAAVGVANFGFTGGAPHPGTYTYAHAYLYQNGDFERSSYPVDFIGSAGGVITSARSYARILAAFMEAGRRGNALLSRESAVEIMTPHGAPVARSPRVQTAWEGSESYYGQGIRISPAFPGGGLFHHSGSLLTANSFFAFHRERRVGVVGMANGNAISVEEVCLTALTELLGLSVEKLRHRITAKAMTAIEGTYETVSKVLAVEVEPFQLGLTLEFLHRSIPRRHYLAPRSVSDRSAVYYDPFSPLPVTAEFYFGSQTTLVFDRYQFVRRSD